MLHRFGHCVSRDAVLGNLDWEMLCYLIQCFIPCATYSHNITGRSSSTCGRFHSLVLLSAQLAMQSKIGQQSRKSLCASPVACCQAPRETWMGDPRARRLPCHLTAGSRTIHFGAGPRTTAPSGHRPRASSSGNGWRRCQRTPAAAGAAARALHQMVVSTVWWR